LKRIDPFIPVAQLSDEEIIEIVKFASGLMSKNLQGYPRRTRFALDGQKHWVYGRNGKVCFKCGARIQLSRQGDLARTTYWCPQCQQP
jgi:endonuclease-8